ncbi:4-hydroxy-tetrahydrodipicolinate reductase [Vreelandella glaciei]|uniref:4-hydroxy-tetrahydrodipicolinate reductase n=1 Tax=Vreelandella glaciei TaxID=186761 RepID=UPI0030EBAC29
MTRIAIVGATGRMGRNLVSAVIGDEHATLASALARSDSPLLGEDIGSVVGSYNINVPLKSDLEDIKDDFDVLIDFTTPEYSLRNLNICERLGKPILIGTTGFSDGQLNEINKHANNIPVILAYNTSLGINLLLDLLSTSAKALGPEGYDIEIVEYHHRHKVDAPSGTAIMIGDVLAKATKTTLSDCGVFQRVGAVGPRQTGEIGISVVRAGDIVGEHTVILSTEGERIEITHKATSRMTFAKGAVKAARWLSKKQPGLYSMRDVLAL